MKLFPSENYVIKTDCTIDEIQDILKRNIGKKAGFFATKKKAFYGSYSLLSFNIIPNIEYLNSFLPIITGNIHDEGSECDIEINMRLFDAVKVFAIIWFSMLALFAIIIMIASFNEIKALLGLIQCIIMAGFMFALIHLGFGYEVKKRKKQLNEMFYVTISESSSSSGYYSF